MIVEGTRHGALHLISSPNRLESAEHITQSEPEPKINLPITWRLANTMYYGDRGHFDCAAMWDGPLA